MHRTSARLFLVGVIGVGLLLSCRRSGQGPVATPTPPGGAPHAPASPRSREVVPEEGGAAAFALEDPFTGLAAARLATASDRIIRGLVFGGLTRMTAAGNVEPELAAGWEMLRDGAEWIFHLRPDTPFSHGRYLEARHVVASWEKVIADENSRFAWLLEPVREFDEMREGRVTHPAGLVLEDGLTLRMVLKRPVRDLPARLAHPALGVSAFGEDEQGIGPFQIWGTPQPQRIVLRSNPDYFRGLPHLDEIAFVRGEAARQSRLAMGDLGGAVLGPFDEAAPGPGFLLFSHSVQRTYVLGLNRATDPFSRLDVARAFLASLDRPALLRAVAGERGRVPETLVAAVVAGRTEENSPPKPRTGAQVSGRIDLVIPDEDRTSASLADKIQAAILRAGGRVSVHAVRPSDLEGVLARGEYHLFLLPYVPSSSRLLLNYEELIGWNRSIPDSMASSIRGLEREGDTAALTASLASLDASLQERGYLIPLLSLERRMLIRSAFCDVRPDPAGSLEWSLLWLSRGGRGECGQP